MLVNLINKDSRCSYSNENQYFLPSSSSQRARLHAESDSDVLTQPSGSEIFHLLATANGIGRDVIFLRLAHHIVLPDVQIWSCQWGEICNGLFSALALMQCCLLGPAGTRAAKPSTRSSSIRTERASAAMR